MPKLLSACRFCAHPLPDNAFLVCGRCIHAKPNFDNVFIAYRFEEPLRTLLHKYKYHGAFFLRHVIAKLMLDALPETAFTSQCLVPVPLHPKRLRERGFNQAAAVCKLLSKKTQIPCDLSLCKKVHHTPPQAHLSKNKRKLNLHRAFVIRPHQYKHITLVDDLLTTGNTVMELTKCLKKHGVQRVDVWCCARAVS